MKIQCPNPNCSHGVKLSDHACPDCGFSLSLGSVIKLCWRRFLDFFRDRAVIRCPECRHPVSLADKNCSNSECGKPVTVEAVVVATLEPRRRWQDFLSTATPTTASRLQWAIFLFSFLILLGTFAYAEAHQTDYWALHALLGACYVVALGALLPLVRPDIDLGQVWRAAGRPMKLALICNYLTLLLVFQLVVAAWWKRALLLAVIALLARVAKGILGAIFSRLANGDDNTVYFDTSDPQGRRGKFD